MEYLSPLIKSFTACQDPVRAEQMQKYMKGLFPFLGLDTKSRRMLQKQFYAEFGYPDQEALFQVANYLWNLNEREYQMCAVDLLRKFQKKLVKDDIKSIEKLIVTKSWWDSVDGLSAWICGEYFILFPEQKAKVTNKWVKGDNMWLQRASLLFQLNYKQDTDTKLLSEYIILLKTEKDFFIRKAIGWILREYSKTNTDWVREFISKVQLSPLSVREASKYL